MHRRRQPPRRRSMAMEEEWYHRQHRDLRLYSSRRSPPQLFNNLDPIHPHNNLYHRRRHRRRLLWHQQPRLRLRLLRQALARRASSRCHTRHRLQRRPTPTASKLQLHLLNRHHQHDPLDPQERLPSRLRRIRIRMRATIILPHIRMRVLEAVVEEARQSQQGHQQQGQLAQQAPRAKRLHLKHRPRSGKHRAPRSGKTSSDIGSSCHRINDKSWSSSKRMLYCAR